ncbi:MAG: InlB B-repeat-containing protein [Clostridia bacterium]|nr:InlB B-repeat-containing protein [Clostridia bacterium]
MKTTARVICIGLCFIMLFFALSVGIGAVAVSDAVKLSTYTADFEDNYYSDLKSPNCTNAEIVNENGSNALSFVLKSDSDKYRFEIYNSKNGVFTLKSDRVYAVTVSYRIVRIGKETSDGATTLSLVRYNGSSDELVKIKQLSGSVYYPGDTTDWITETVVFKSTVSPTDQYTRLAVNVVSQSCSKVETGVESRTTEILFDNITVTECGGETKAVEFDTNGGDRCEPILAKTGEAIELPTPSRELFDFDGWYTDTELTKKFNKTAMPSNNTRLYAKWKVSADAVAVNYVTNNGQSIVSSVGRAGDTLTLPYLTRENFHFAGWYDKSLKQKQELTAFPSETVTLYAKWEPIPRLCSFDNKDIFPEPNGGAISKRYEITDKSAAGGKYSLYYDYWKAYPESKGKTGYARCILRDEYGEYIRVTKGKTYSVTFKYKVVGIDEPLKMGEFFGIVASNKGSAWSGDVIQIPYYDGYRYTNDVGKGWKTCTLTFTANYELETANCLSIGVGGVSKVYIDEVYVSEYDKQFPYENKGSMLCFETQDGITVDTVYAERGTEVTLPKPEREGYRFGGWYYDAELLEAVETDTVTLDKQYMLLYAEWFEISNDPEPTPEPEPQPQPPVKKTSAVPYIIVAAVAVAVIAGAVVTVAIVKKRRRQ